MSVGRLFQTIGPATFVENLGVFVREKTVQ